MKKFTPLIIFIAILNIIAFGTHKIANQQNSLQISHFPQFSLPLLNDQKQFFSDKDLKQQYSLINFFASWCSSCKVEHSLLMKLKNQKNLKLYGIAWRDIDIKTKEFLKSAGNPYEIVATDSSNKLGQKINLQGTPESFLLNQEGKIIFHHRGPLTNFEVEKIKKLVRKN